MKNLEQLKQQYQKLGEEIERLEKDEPWEPEYGDVYWFLDIYGLPSRCVHEGREGDQALYQRGNSFPTKEGANLRGAQIRAFMKMMKHADGGNWANFFDSYNDTFLRVTRQLGVPEHPIKFSTEEKAKAALEELTEEEKSAWFKGKL